MSTRPQSWTPRAPLAAFLALLLSLGLAPYAAHAQGTTLTTVRVAQLTRPIALASAPGDLDRLFIVAQQGRIDILDVNTNQLKTTPFLTGLTAPNVPGGNGMLGMCFHPQFASNHRFYLSLSSSTGIRVIEGSVNPETPDVANTTFRTVAIIGTTSGGQHTGGWIAFGNDGYFYIPIGDGHSSARGQDPTTLYGKFLRLDVDGADNIPGNDDDDGFPADAARNYTIPPSNPYADGVAALPEIWAKGLRNPYRGSVDPVTGDMWWGEVGDQWEEVNRLPAGVPALNFGRGFTEGMTCNSTPQNCATPGLVNALFAYRTNSQAPFGGSSIMGGLVYRGCAIPQLHGTFLFADFSRTWLGGLRVENNALTFYTDHIAGLTLADDGITGFGADGRGEVYFCRLYGNDVYKIVPAADRDCDDNGLADGCHGGPTCQADFNGDCAVDINDLLGFLLAFEQGAIAADYALDSGVLGYDAGVSISDLLQFLARFEAGC